MNRLGVNYCNRFGLSCEEYLTILKNTGFDTFFAGCGKNSGYADKDDPAITERVANKAASLGLCLESFHAPYSGINKIWSDGEDGDTALKGLTNAVEDCKRFGVPLTVVHLSSGDNSPCVSDAGKARFDKLIECAVKNDIIVAFENQRKLANIAFVFELYKDVPNVRFCWDVGHEKCLADGMEFMPLFGDRLCYTHIHDNYGVHDEDMHMIPFDAGIDYTRTAYWLSKYAKDVTFTLEVFPERTVSHEKYKSLTAEEFYERAFNAAKRLREMAEAERQKLKV